MWRAPRSWTHTSTSGQRCASAPAAPAWSRWMWVSRIRAGTKSPSSSSRVSSVDSGPGSTITSSSTWQQITSGTPRCRTSMSRTRDHHVLEAQLFVASGPCTGMQRDEVQPRRPQRLEQPLLLERHRLLRHPWVDDRHAVDRRTERQRRRRGLRVQHERRREHPPARREDPPDLAEVVQRLVGREVGQDRHEHAHVEGAVVERERVRDRRRRAAGVIARVAHVGVDEHEVREVVVAPPAPGDRVRAHVEAGVEAVDREVARQRPREPSDPAADVEHPIRSLQLAEPDQVREELVADRAEVALPHRQLHPPRRHQSATAPGEPVAGVERPQTQGGARSPRHGAGHRAGPYNRGPMTPSHRLPEPDRPWMMRTYSGHSTAEASNALYRSNLAKGQTGLSIAFDLPTQTGYDPDHELARGEVGKVGVPVAHRGDMRTLLDGIPLDAMNTSMTINATAAWLLALYIVTAEEHGIDPTQLQGTTQNDIIKEFLARGTYAFPPGPSMRLIADMVAYTVEHVPRWNPVNICSYHLQEAGATPVQEIAYSLANAMAVLDAVRERVPDDVMPRVFGRISFFVNAGVRFVEEHAKLRAMATMWERLGGNRYGVTDERHLRFRYGVQVNSLGLTESQPENNVQRIVLEALAVTLGRDARARSVQLPAWNEALGLPRPWDQQWSLRIQQVLAYETDLLEYPDIFEGSKVMDGLVAELIEGAQAELDVVAEHGGAVKAVDYMKAALVDSHRERIRRIEFGEQVLVGVNRFESTERSPLVEGADGGILTVDPAQEAQQREALSAWRAQRDQDAVDAALARLADAAAGDENVMAATLAAARAGATTGEWAATLRAAFGEFRAPTGVGEAAAGVPAEDLEALREEVERVAEALGRRPKILVGKPGLDGHSNGAEQIAVRARDIGMDVVYEGIRLTPAQIAASALQEGVHVVGLSILSGSHRELIPLVMTALRERGVDAPVVVGGIIPEADVEPLRQAGVAAVYTPKDFDLTRIMRDVVALVAERHGVEAAA